ncbi:MAG: serine/threonine-protein kinase [Planctomycetota bacterium]
MTAVQDHLTDSELRSLIDGSVDEASYQSWTAHLDRCASCQEALQTIATGEIPIEALVANHDQHQPSSESAYWPAVADVQEEIAEQIRLSRSADHQSVTESIALVGSESSVMRSQATTDRKPMDGSHVSHQGSSSYPNGLPFLQPSDDPAYLGRLQHFEIARVIGQGGMGIVLEAFDTHLARPVAIKVLNPQYQDNQIARQRFCREGRAAAAINHEHVVAMHQVAKADQDQVAFLVMQLIEGETLEDRLSEGNALPPGEAARIGMQIASGLSAAHKQGMVHRDVKPANILLEEETDRVKLTDFGLARAADDVKLTKTGMVTGTPLYMSPEQTLGEVADERSDLFSLGAVLYEMVTGIAPFAAPSALGVIKRILDETPSPAHQINPQIPKPFSELIASLMAKKPEDRPESSALVASALAATAQSLGSVSPMQVPAIAASDAGKISGSYSRQTRRYVLGAWVAGCVALLAFILTVAFRSGDVQGDAFPSVVLPDNPGTVWSIDFSDDGKHLLAAIEDGTVRWWDTTNQQLDRSFNAHRGIVWMVKHAPDGELIATCGDDGLVKFWDAADFELVNTFDAQSAVRGIAFSPDGTQLVAGSRNGIITIIDVASASEIRSAGQSGSILGVAFSADGKSIATGGSDKVVRVFDAQSLAIRQKLEGHTGPIYNVTFANNGQTLATVGWNKNVIVWNVANGQLVNRLRGSDGDVWGVSFCADGSHLVTGEQLGAARVWDVATGKALATLRGHSSAVHNIALDPSSRRIATCSRDGTIRVWDMSGLE